MYKFTIYEHVGYEIHKPFLGILNKTQEIGLIGLQKTLFPSNHYACLWFDYSIKRPLIRGHEEKSLNENKMIFKQNSHCLHHIAIRGHCYNFKSSTHYIMILKLEK